jgi:hypothetical protein
MSFGRRLGNHGLLNLMVVVTIPLGMAWVLSCGSSDTPVSGAGGSEQTGSECTSVAQCYPGLDGGGTDGGLLKGEPLCLDKVTGGYCTHTCTADSDCCAVPGECISWYPQVCSPFESTSDQYCFLSCEDAQVADAGVADANSYCSTFAHTGFGCRSSGGGSNNRKVCMP